MNDKQNTAPKNGGKPESRYTPTKHNHLRRATATGVYVLAVKYNGRQYVESLETTDEKIALARRDDRIKEIKKSADEGNHGKGTLTLQEALDAHKANLERRRALERKSRTGISAKTLSYYQGCINKLVEKIPTPALGWQLEKITAENLQSWVYDIQKDFSASLYNGCVIVLRELFEIGIARSACRANVAKKLELATPAEKNIVLPTHEQWAALVSNIRANADPGSVERREIVRAILEGYTQNVEANYEKAFLEHPDWRAKLGLSGNPTKKQWHKVYDLAHYIRHEENFADRRGHESADLVEFLTYTGARINETTCLTFADVDFAANPNLITFRVETVKGKTRAKVIAINAALLPVLARCKQRAALRGDNKVFGIKECRKAISNACARLKFPHWSHHDFRHFFASEALVNGAAPILVADALGQSDKGRTLLDKYAHVRAAQAAPAVLALQFGNRNNKAARIAALKAQLAALETDESEESNIVALKA